MFRRKKSDAITYGIVGLGRFGYALAMELAAFGADIMVMDSDEDKVRAMAVQGHEWKNPVWRTDDGVVAEW